MKRAKSKAKQYTEDSIEKIIGGSFDQILGFSGSEKKQDSRGGDLKPGQEISFAKPQEEKAEAKEEKAYIEAAIDYSREIVHVGERAASHENQELEYQLREIMAEIKKLADSSKELQMQFKTVAVEQHAVKPGKYHKNFFSWLLSVIRSARMKVEDSGAWLHAMQNKKKSRGYNEMSKKHGTSFSLSNERNVSTQVG